MDIGKLLDRITQFTTVEQCDAFIKNAKRNNLQELVDAASQRRQEIDAAFMQQSTPAGRDGWLALKAWEEEQAIEYGSKFRAVQTRALIEQQGIVATIEKIVLQRDWDIQRSDLDSELNNVASEEFSFESIVVRYPEEFSLGAVERAADHMDMM